MQMMMTRTRRMVQMQLVMLVQMQMMLVQMQMILVQMMLVLMVTMMMTRIRMMLAQMQMYRGLISNCYHLQLSSFAIVRTTGDLGTTSD
jgi:hypothetical protein